MKNIYTKFLSSELWHDFERYFEFKGKCSGCWCMNHRLPIGLDFEGEAAKLAMKQLVMSNRVFGILAYCEGEEIPVGWASLDKRKTLPGHDCIEEDIDCASSIWSIHCVTTREDFKGQGVERILIDHAIDLAKTLGATEIEAYPEPNSQEGRPFQTWNSFNGYENIFSEAQFKDIDKNYGDHKNFYKPMRKSIDEKGCRP